MNSVKWGVLGTANIAASCTIPGLMLSESSELYAIAGRSPEKAGAFKEKYGFKKACGSYEELLDDEDIMAVYIPLPNSLHFEWVKKALKKGKNVLCEKPLALNEGEIRELFETAEKSGVILMEAYAYLHSPYVKSLKKDVESGIIGEIDYIDTAFLTQGYSEDIRIHKETGGGAMYDLGCYCTTMILTLMDEEIETVKGIAEFTDEGVDSLTSVMIRFKNGALASFNAGMILGKDTPERLDRLYIHGTKGSIVSDVEYNQSGELSYVINTEDSIITRNVTVPQNYSLETEQLCRCILNGEKPYISAEFSIKNAALMDRIFKEIG